jgi:hypothetical protein
MQCRGRLIADSGEVTYPFRDYVARRYEMMSPGGGRSVSGSFWQVGAGRSILLDRSGGGYREGTQASRDPYSHLSSVMAKMQGEE